MNAKDALKEAASRAGVSITSIGQALGLCKTAASGCRQNTGALTLASFAAVCGYALILVPEESIPANAIIIDPVRTSTSEALIRAKQKERDALARRLAALDEELIG